MTGCFTTEEYQLPYLFAECVTRPEVTSTSNDWIPDYLPLALHHMLTADRTLCTVSIIW